MNSTDDIIADRRKTHGPFEQQFAFAQTLKLYFRYSPNWDQLSGVQKESLELIATKLSRILTGNPNEPDHFSDIAGYARLVEMHLHGISDQRDARPEPAPKAPAEEPAPHTVYEEPMHADPDDGLQRIVELTRPKHPSDATRYTAPIGPKLPHTLQALPPEYTDRKGVPNKEDFKGPDLEAIQRELDAELDAKRA